MMRQESSQALGAAPVALTWTLALALTLAVLLPLPASGDSGTTEKTGKTGTTGTNGPAAGPVTERAGDYIGPDEVLLNIQKQGPVLAKRAAGAWNGNVYVLPYTFGGSYARDNLDGTPNGDPRRWVTTSFISDNADQYDFVVVFTNFGWESGDARGLYWSIANDVEGIGVDLFDYSTAWGSENIQGYIDAKMLSDFITDDGSLDTQWTTELLNHELGHRWLSHARFLDGGDVSEALLGRDGAHWSYLLSSEASFMYGSDWRDNGDGTFTAVAVRQRFSHLDLYLMGILAPEEVPAFDLLVNPAIDVTQLPMPGATEDATARTLMIDDVIAAEGPRVPTSAETRHELRVGFIYLVSPGTTPSDIELALLEQLRTYWQTSYFQYTLGRGVVDVGQHGTPETGGTDPDLNRALQWLEDRATDGGGIWADSNVSWMRDTAEGIDALGRAGGYAAVVQTALAELNGADPATSVELEARRCLALASQGAGGVDQSAAALLAAEVDGGWSVYPRYLSDPVTTARVIRALAAAGQTEAASRGWQWLAARQEADGGWAWSPGGPSMVSVTQEVLLAVRQLDPDFWVRPEVQSAVSWLVGGQIDGGFGDGFATVEQTALFLLVTMDQGVDQLVVQDAIELLAARQLPDGSWGGSTYATALAVNALVSFALPDPVADDGELFVDPAEPFDDDGLEAIVAIRNAGLPIAAGVPCEWQLWTDTATPALVLLLPCTLPDLPDIGFVTMTETLPAQPPGSYELRFVIDPEQTISEKDRANNTARLPLEVRSHPDGVDLQLTSADISTVPDRIGAIPQPMNVVGVVHNLGLSDATAAPVTVWLGAPSAGVLLGSTTIDVPALDLAAFSVPVWLPDPRSVTLTVVADPDRTTGDPDLINNRATVDVPLELTTDLEVVPGTAIATPAAVQVGEAVHLEAVVRNGGTLDVTSFEVAFVYDSGDPLQRFTITSMRIEQPLEPGQTVPVEADWVPNVPGDPMALRVVIDPEGSLSDVDPADNEAVLPLTVGPSSLPNLRITHQELAFDPGPPLEGQVCQITATIANPTLNDAGPFTAELWLDEIGTGQLVTSQSLPGLAAGTAVDLIAAWDVVEEHDRLVHVTVDPTDAVIELVEDDNEAFIEVDVQTLPDLALSSGGVDLTPDFPRSGDVVHFDVLVTNLGDQGSVPTQLELVAEDGSVIDSIAVPALEGHEDTTLRMDWDTAGFSGSTTLTVRVDHSDVVIERYEENNRASVDVAVQEADLYLSNRLFSPNGDGVKDTTTIFFRTGAEVIEIRSGSGFLVRTLIPPEGGESVIWDGLSDRGNLARDGIYEVDAGTLTTWVGVDTNRYAITRELHQRLLVGFLQPRVPGDERPRPWDPEGNTERSWFTSLFSNPLTEEVFAVEQYHAAETSTDDDTFTLWKFAGDDLIKLGELPEQLTLSGASAAGDVFLVGQPGWGDFGVVRMPDLAYEELTPPSWGYDAYLSPDGRWVLWVSPSDEMVVLQDMADLDIQYSLDGGELWISSVCGYTVSWEANGEAIVSLTTWDNEGFIYRIDPSADSPSVVASQAEGWTGQCGGGGYRKGRSGDVRTASATGSGDAKSELGTYQGPQTGVKIDEELLTWLAVAGGGEMPSKTADGTGADKARVAGYGGNELAVGVYSLIDGSEREKAPFDPGGDPWSPPEMSLSNDGDAVAVADYFWAGEKAAGQDMSASQDKVLWLDLPPGFASGQEAAQSAAESRADNPFKATTSPVEQYLMTWRDGGRRGLPLRLQTALWSPADKYLVGDLDSAEDLYSDMVPYLTPAANLTVRLKPRVLFGDAGVDLWVLVTDRYLSWYQLEYTDLDADGGTYHQIGIPSAEPLYGERWGTWLPPSNGRYRVRLVASDRAGNLLSYAKKVTWNGDNDIANLYTESRYISPRSSPGVKDIFTFSYTVLRPSNLLFVIQDSSGNAVRQIPVSALDLGQQSTTWDGTDDSGFPVPDGEYLLTYGEASWPITVDNAPPEVVLRFGASRWVLETIAQVNDDGSTELIDGTKDLRIAELFAAVRDGNLIDWSYERLLDPAEQTWWPIFAGADQLEADGQLPWRTYGLSWLVGQRLRIVARDLAGNETVTETAHRDEGLFFTESEPGCRYTSDPCIYPDRPVIESIGDGGSLLRPEGMLTLDPYYDTLLVSSSVWTDQLVLELEYRQASMAGLPAGPWTPGVIQTSTALRNRSFCTGDVSVTAGAGCSYNRGLASDDLVAVYWDHPSMAQLPVEVRLRATNTDGVELISDPRLLYPSVPLTLEHIGVDDEGDHLLVTNVSDGAIRDLKLQIYRVPGYPDEPYWETLVPIVDRLAPGFVAELKTGCLLITEGNQLLRAVGVGGLLAEEASSTPARVPDREGYSRLKGPGFFPGRCPLGSASGSGLFGIEHESPCEGVPPWPERWSNNGDGALVSGRVPVDPAEVPYSAYELLVDGVPVLRIDGPMDSSSYSQAFDLSSISEGSHTVRERYIYDNEPGLLGTCPQSFPLTVDRTPPLALMSAPVQNQYVCPADLTMDVVFADTDSNGAGRKHEIFINDVYVGGSAGISNGSANGLPPCPSDVEPSECPALYSGHTGSIYEIPVNCLTPGTYDVRIRTTDRAGFAACSSVQVVVPDLPLVRVSASPKVFSPTNLRGQPDTVVAELTIGTPGQWEARVLNESGTIVRQSSGFVYAADEDVELVWDGRLPGGAVAPDGRYTISIIGRSPCGAEDSASASVVIDTVPPVIEVTELVPGTEVGRVLTLLGSIADPEHNGEAGVLEARYLDGGSGEWEEVAPARGGQTADHPTISTWLTWQLERGDYLIRLRAWDDPGNESLSAEILVTLVEFRFIRRFDRDPELFSPNMDGLLDTVDIFYELIQDALVTLSVQDSAGFTRATLVDHELVPDDPTGRNLLWMGRESGGATVEDGMYWLVLRAEDPASPPLLAPEEERLAVTVDTTPPELAITNPGEGTLHALPLDIIGSHHDLSPYVWTLILDGTEIDTMPLGAGSSTFTGKLISRLDDGQVPDGEYVATFEATDRVGNSSRMVRRFVIDNTAPVVEIFEPEVGAVKNTENEYLSFDGEVRDDHLVSFTWMLAPGFDPDPADFVVLRTGGPTYPQGANDSFAWDGSDLADGMYTVLLSGIDELGLQGEGRTLLVVDNTPPLVSLDQPANGAVIADPTDITGEVDDVNLSRWTLTLLSADGEPVVPDLATGASPVSGTIVTWAVLPPDGQYVLHLYGEDRAGSSAEVEHSVEIRTEPPTPPVITSAEILNRTDAALEWVPGPGPEPDGYLVLRDGAMIAGPINELQLVDPGLVTGSYTYTVRAVTLSGYETEDSNPAMLEVDLRPPVAVIAMPSDGARLSDLVRIIGTADRAGGGLAGWELWVHSLADDRRVLMGSGTGPVVTELMAVWDTTGPQWPEGLYELSLTATDIFANSVTDTVTVEIDNTAPVAPVLTVAYSEIQDGDGITNDIHVEWTLTPIPPDLAGYYLYRNGLLANAPGPILGSQTPFLLDDIVYDDKDLPDGTYVYWVTAADTAENESVASNESDPIVIDTRRPHAVIVDPLDGSQFEQSVLITAECPDLDVVSVQLEYMPSGGSTWEPLGPPQTSRSPWTAVLAPDTDGYYDVRAVASDALGPDPDPESIQVEMTDLPPAKPQELEMHIDGRTIDLEWTAVADPTGDLAGYLLWRNGQLLTPTPLPPSQLEYTDTDLVDDYYTYQLRAVDTEDNQSPAIYVSGEVSTARFEHLPPILASASVQLDVEVGPYYDTVELQRQDAGGSFVTDSTYSLDGSWGNLSGVSLVPGANVLRIRGEDNDGNRGVWSRELVLIRHDPPAPVDDLAAAVTGSDVEVSWLPSADPDLAGYTVLVDGGDATTGTAPFTYDSATHQLEASSGMLAGWELAVDGTTATSWTPPGDTSLGWYWQWTWDDPELLDDIVVRWVSGAYARRFSVEVRVDGHWLWWSYVGWTSTSTRSWPLGIEATGVRLVVPSGGWCSSTCTLSEVTLDSRSLHQPATFDDPGVPDGAYEYEVLVYNRLGQESDPTTIAVQVGGTVATPPGNLTASASGCSEITLTWDEPVPAPASPEAYRVWRATGGGLMDYVVQLPWGRHDWVDTGLIDGETYRYQVTAVSRIDGVPVDSPPSAEVTATAGCRPAPPVLFEPTVAGAPISWPSDRAPIGGRGWPGSEIGLLHDGDLITSLLLDGTEPDQIHHLSGEGDSGIELAIAPGGTHVAWTTSVLGGIELRVLELATGQMVRLTTDDGFSPSLSSSGDRVAFIAYSSAGRDVFVATLPEGEVRQLTTDGDWKQAVAISPDGRKVAVVNESGQPKLQLIDVGSGAASVLYNDDYWDGIDWPVFSPDGSKIAFGSYQGPRVVEVATGLLTEIWVSDHCALGRRPFSADGRYLVWTVQPSWDPSRGYPMAWDLINDDEVEQLGFGSGTGQLSAVFLGGGMADTDTVALLRLVGGKGLPLTGGDVEVVLRSLADGNETVLGERVALAGLPMSTSAGWDLQTTSEGSLWVPQDGDLLQLHRGSGRFRVPDVPLHPGENRFVARQTYGAYTAESEAIVLNVATDGFGDAEAVAVGAVPAFPLSGDMVRVDGVIRNAGAAPLEDLVITLVRVEPDGLNVTAAVETVDLEPGRFHTVRVQWDTTGIDGDVGWYLKADPINALVELDETNNTASTVVPVRLEAGAEVAVATDRLEYDLGEQVLVTVDIEVNDVAAPRRVLTLLEAGDGSLVETLDERDIDTMAYASDSWTVSWRADEIYPGPFRARAQILDASGVEAEASTTFDVLAHLAVAAAGTADRTSYQIPATALFTARINNQGSAALSHGTARLQVEPAGGGGALAGTSIGLGQLPAGGSRNLSWTWSSGVASPGLYQLVVLVQDEGGSIVARSTPYPFLLIQAETQLGGSVAATPSVLEPGTLVEITAEVTNLGDAGLLGVPIHIDIVDLEAGAAVDHLEVLRDLAAGITVPISLTMTPSATRLGPYVVVLSALRNDLSPPELQMLATTGLRLADLTPPVLELLEPEARTYCDEVPIRARARDALSDVLRVDYALDFQEPAVAMTLEWPEDIVWGSRWYVQPTQLGSHTISVTAQDAAGNVSAPIDVPIDVIFDGDEPQLVLTGPDDGSCVPGPASVIIEATDINLSEVVALLDGVPYLSGDPITDGSHHLEVRATDACGHEATASRDFLVDSIVPDVVVTGVSDGSSYLPPLTIDWTVDDLNLVSAEALLDGLAVTAPLVVEAVGSHLLQVSGLDCAGNLGQVVISFEISPEALDLAGTLDLVPAAIEPPEATTATGGIVNRGTQDLEGVALRLELVDPSTATVLDTYSEVGDLPGEGSVSIVHAFDTSALAWQDYTVRLGLSGSYYGDVFDIVVAEAVLVVEDRTPPAVTMLSPSAGIGCDPQLVQAQVVDTLSGVAGVQARIDGGALIVLALITDDPALENVWQGELPVGSGGTHLLEVLSADNAGNASSPLGITLEIDTEAPLLTVGAPDDGVCLAGPVVLTFEATDLALTELVATLDGQPISSGDEISDEGLHELVVVARDGCGRETGHTSSFIIDMTDPLVDVVGVTDGGTYSGEVTIEWTVDDASPVDTLALLDGVSVATPLVVDTEGEHVLEINATDCAGNLGSVTVGFTVEAGAPLVLSGVLEVLPEEATQGEPVQITGEVTNEGLAAVQEINVEIAVIEVSGGGVAQTAETVLSLDAGQSQQLVTDLVTGALDPGQYQVELRATGTYNGDAYDLLLATGELEILERAEIPDLSGWGRLLLILALAACGVWALRRTV